MLSNAVFTLSSPPGIQFLKVCLLDVAVFGIIIVNYIQNCARTTEISRVELGNMETEGKLLLLLTITCEYT